MSDFQKRIENLSPKRLMLLALELQSRIEEIERQQTEPIAVIGIGCRIPGAEEGPDAFWRLLQEARNSIGEVPRDRWEAAAYYDGNTDAPGRMSTKWGGFLSHIDQFDAPFFGIAGREAMAWIPNNACCWRSAGRRWSMPAIPRASWPVRPRGFSWESAPPTIRPCCWRGARTQSMPILPAAQLRVLRPDVFPTRSGCRVPAWLSTPLVPRRWSRSISPVRVCARGNAPWPSPAASMLILSPTTTIALSKAHMMAPDGRCKTFDSRADGFVRGEGCGIVVLKRLSDAVADGDHILALIRGSAVNQDGRSSGLTAPNGTAQEALIRAGAGAMAGVQPDEIGYVEAHGTGTSLGDPIEAHALAAVLGPGRRSRKSPGRGLGEDQHGTSGIGRGDGRD